MGLRIGELGLSPEFRSLYSVPRKSFFPWIAQRYEGAVGECFALQMPRGELQNSFAELEFRGCAFAKVRKCTNDMRATTMFGCTRGINVGVAGKT